MASKQELAIIYAALVLEDEGVPITTDKVNKLLQAAGVQVEPFWPGLYVKALEGVNISELISNIGSGAGAAPAQAASAPAAAAAAAPVEEKKKKEEAKAESEEDEDLGFGLFD